MRCTVAPGEDSEKNGRRGLEDTFGLVGEGGVMYEGHTMESTTDMVIMSSSYLIPLHEWYCYDSLCTYTIACFSSYSARVQRHVLGRAWCAINDVHSGIDVALRERL